MSEIPEKKSERINQRVSAELRERVAAIYEKFGVSEATVLTDALNALCDYVEREREYRRPLVMTHAGTLDALLVIAEGQAAYGEGATAPERGKGPLTADEIIDRAVERERKLKAGAAGKGSATEKPSPRK